MRQHLDLENLVRPIIEKLGYSFIGIELAAEKGAILRIYIDSEQGISTDDCQKVSYQINQILNVEAASKNNYRLEVSSPGIDRKLYSIEQCTSQIGKPININLAYPIGVQRNFKGRLHTVEGKQLRLSMDNGEEIVFNFEDIEWAKVVPEW